MSEPRAETQAYRPSPFADTARAPGGSADGGTAAAATVTIPTAKLAWEDAWEEAAEAPVIAAAFSSAISCSYHLSHQQISVAPAEAAKKARSVSEPLGA